MAPVEEQHRIFLQVLEAFLCHRLGLSKELKGISLDAC